MQVAIVKTYSGSVYMLLVLVNGMVPVGRSAITALAIQQVSGTDTGMPQGTWLKLDRFDSMLLPGYRLAFVAHDKVADEDWPVTTSGVDEIRFVDVGVSVPLGAMLVDGVMATRQLI